MSELPVPPPTGAPAVAPDAGRRRVPLVLSIWHAVENGALVAALALMIVLPLVEALLRRFWGASIPGAAVHTQHLVLVVAMLGGAVAAREGRLLSLSTLTGQLPEPWRAAARVFSGAAGVSVSLFLLVASLGYIEVEKGGTLPGGIPLVAMLAVMPIGFGLVALRLWWHSADDWRGRAATLGLVTLTAALFLFPPVPRDALATPCIVLLLLATALGSPVFCVLGGLGLILFQAKGEPIAALSISHYEMVINPSLPAIPLFTLAGYFLAEGGASRRLVRVFNALFGHVRGGPAAAAVLVCTFFTCFTGASGVTILALGGLLLPVLVASRYSDRNAIGLLTGSGSLGLLFPPCLPPILYAIVASQVGADKGVRVGISEIFLGGVLPGLVLMGLTIAWGVSVQAKGGSAERTRFSAREAGQAIREAKWELALPVVAVVTLLSGVATPVEAAAVTALYAFVVETFFYRDLRLSKDAPRVMTECALLVGGILLILGVAMGFTNYLIDAQVPDRMVDWVRASLRSPFLFLLALNVFLLVVGCLMDIYSAIIVVVPLIVPIGAAFGIDPVHLGIVFLANLELGFLTPPVGMNLFMASYRFQRPMPEIVRSILPLLLIRAVGALLITYVPVLSTLLPRLAR